MENERLKKLIKKLKEKKVFGEDTSHKLIIGFVASFITILAASVGKHFLIEDIGGSVKKIIPQIVSWWDSGACFTKQEIISGAEITISPVVGKIGVAMIIVILFVIIFKLDIKNPKK